ncbi:MAG: hypothetical protein RLZZ419_414 [Pseudomonadota bacterium]
MPLLVTSGAVLSCTFGTAPSTFVVLQVNPVMVDMPAANIMDNIPLVNILPFGLCSSITNPTVTSATAAALGVLTPMPCIPATVAPWVAGAPTVLIGNMAALSSDSKLLCSWAGSISISSAGQVPVTL